MIHSVEEFIHLRTSENASNYQRSVHENAPTSVWVDIIESHPEMCEWIAQNKTVSIDILEKLSQSADPKVRFVVAMKRRLTTNLFEKLSKDKDVTVRQRIACNKKTPLEILEYLVNDKEKMVSEFAQRQIKERGSGRVGS